MVMSLFCNVDRCVREAYFSPLKLKLSLYTPRKRFGGEEVYLLLILDLGTRCG
jgi:hypothetical protein